MITCGGRAAEKSIFEIDFDEEERTHNGFRERRGVLVHGGGERIVQRIAHTDQARRELGRAVQTADGLVRRLGLTGYPHELSRLVGHRPDAHTPFMVTTRRGIPLGDSPDGLPMAPRELWPVVDGIIAVLTLLGELRLVHRNMRPDTLLWDGATVQLADFGMTVHEGEPRGASVGADLWRSPEQASGQGSADCRDDVYAAGAVVFHLATGEDLGTAADLRSRVRLQETALRNLLDGVFTDLARDRVSGYALRQRRKGPSGRPGPYPRETGLTGREQQARDNFLDLRRRQRAFRQRHTPRPSGPPTPPWPSPGVVRSVRRDRISAALVWIALVSLVVGVIVVVALA